LPDDPKKIVADPMFAAPGTGGNGLHTVNGYRLCPGSPCINAGLFASLNSKRDYYDNPVNDGSVDIGAYEQIGSGVFADKEKEEALNQQERRKSRMAWSKWIFPRSIPINEDGNVLIRLREPLEKEISGTLVWSDKQGKNKPVTVQLDKLKDRNMISFSLKTDKSAWLDSSVRVSLKEGDLSEEWDIPFSLVNP
jgi:hypothetical protein